jgi:CHAT domain-containing protein
MAGNLSELMEQLAQEPQKRRRRELLTEAREWWQPATVTRLYDEMVRLARIDLRQAERLALAASWLSGRIDDEASRATALRAVGHIYFLKGNHPPACEHYQKALEIYQRLGMELEAGRTLNGSLQAMIYLGRYDEAFTAAQTAYEIFSRHGDRLRLARLDNNMANILYRQDRFAEALNLYRRAYATFSEIGEPQDVAIAMKNMATPQISLNHFHDALETYNAARAYAVEHGMPLVVAESDYNIAYLYYLRGEYARAIELYRATREHCKELGDTYHQGLCDLDQSEMYLELNLVEEGAHLARRALDTFRQLGMGYETAKSLTNLAIATNYHGDAPAALELFRRARDRFSLEKNLAWTAITDLYQAMVYHQQGRLGEARQLCESALRYFAPSPWAGKAALCQLLLARIHLNAGRPEEARRVCLEALAKLASAESPALSYQAYFVLGLIEEALHADEAAHEAYRQAHARLENLRSHLKAEETKVAFLKDKLAIYEALVRMCLRHGVEDGGEERAFAYIEQAKSRSLADLIAFRGTRPAAAHQKHPEQAREAATLREELTWYSRAIQLAENAPQGVKPAQMDELRRAARECEQRLVEAMASLRADDPEFANLHAGGSIDLENIRAVLPEDAMLVQYYRLGDTFHACLVSRRGLRIVPVGSAPAMRRRLQLLRFQLSKSRLGPDYMRTFQQQLLDATNAHLREFYRQLIAPLAIHLDAVHLIIAPHEFLHYLPFHALLDGDTPLGDRFTISYTPSASVFYLCATKRATASEGALILGVADDAAPFIKEEVAAVARALPQAEIFEGEKATLDVLREKGSRSRIVHIATHGWFRQDNPMFSCIRLGNSDLSLFDLYQLNLPCDLVTLSGCGTGLNVVVGGDELLGLKRGFLYAGARSLLLTLWDVHDRSTAEFMKLFYGHLVGGANKAQAMQSAMSEIRVSYPHPFYWAPFVLVGKYDADTK